MFRYVYALLVLCSFMAVGAQGADTHAMRFAPTIDPLTQFDQPSKVENGCGLFIYTLKDMHYPRATEDMIRAVAHTDQTISLYDAQGRMHDYRLSPKRLTFWIYARFQDAWHGKSCDYVVVNGFAPTQYSRIQANGRFAFTSSEGTKVVLRNCGTGYGVVNLEGYDSIFNAPEIRDTPLPVPLSAVHGLAGSCVATALRVAGGKTALESYLAQRSVSYRLQPVLKAAFAKAGVRLPPTR